MCEGSRMWHRLGDGQEGARSAAGWPKVGAGRFLAESSAFQELSLLEYPQASVSGCCSLPGPSCCCRAGAAQPREVWRAALGCER